MKILLIEDDRIERKMIRRWLEGSGWRVFEASDGNEGLAQCRRHRPDLVITDIVMPDKEGIELIIDIRFNDPDIKLIAISGAGNRPGEYLPIAKAVGAQRTFLKPIDRAELIDAVQALHSPDQG